MTIWLEIEARKQRVDLPAAALGFMQCVVDGRTIQADAQMVEPGVLSLIVDGRQYGCVLDGDGVWIGGKRYSFVLDDPRSLAGRRGSGAGAEGPRPVKAPMPGRVVRVLVAAGEEVADGQGVVVIEAMKMQNELKSPKSGRVSRVAVTPGDTVGSGDILVIVE
ncbi:acetyl-CoA carboxylase biotin carboxyl carrier protein subunit [Edaphobacter acidisoli]|uniref:Acetyl-CoA carboxylase biotin carboxyl carrier protein subunit n=1 Tax=Edaphobacter acidisoli TaxID=2040573 RepID=A0A916RV33_9BACT|nr:acetyl-CoA carboxylase biotin carboxyl carrier protein subunit [Edaphobacter acidisoli]GGA72519.1 acetyl-CoA carboxylase biotin carboxyl carrier protein subunit [Edaphobacter acidisoli]